MLASKYQKWDGKRPLKRKPCQPAPQINPDRHSGNSSWQLIKTGIIPLRGTYRLPWSMTSNHLSQPLLLQTLGTTEESTFLFCYPTKIKNTKPQKRMNLWLRWKFPLNKNIKYNYRFHTSQLFFSHLEISKRSLTFPLAFIKCCQWLSRS